VTRPILVSDAKRRILYVEGEPRWEYKFIRRAEDDDPTVQVVSMLRTSENKIYRQGLSDPNELADGFRYGRRTCSVIQASSSALLPPITSRHCNRSFYASMSIAGAAASYSWGTIVAERWGWAHPA